MHYGTEHTGFEQYRDRSPEYKPDHNKKNIYERKLERRQVPSTRDRFTKNVFSQLLQPTIDEKAQFAKETYQHDKLNVKDIEGTDSDVYRKQKMI